MSDFSFFSLFTAGLACLIPLTSAYTHPKGAAPKGNPIHEPNVNSIVPVGQDFAITWTPTTKGTVTLLLLKGPSTNAVPQYPIAQKVPNDGTFIWVPATDLAPGQTGYGIQLIDDATGQYQYSTQFGIANPDYHEHGHSSSSSGWETSTTSCTTTETSSPAPYHTKTETWTHSHVSTHTPWPTHSHTANHTATWSTTTKPHHHHHTAPPPAPPPPQTTVAPPPPPPPPKNSTNGTQPSPSPNAGVSNVATSFVSFIVAAGIAVLAL